ncbi:hypothetical protein KEM52_003593 [Ascosphaera acerosa]|nr:hypothetical protein KEM52_003593 [Ascosphaera acerosa]
MVDRTDSWARSIPYGKPPPTVAAAPPRNEQAGTHLEGIRFGESPGNLRGVGGQSQSMAIVAGGSARAQPPPPLPLPFSDAYGAGAAAGHVHAFSTIIPAPPHSSTTPDSTAQPLPLASDLNSDLNLGAANTADSPARNGDHGRAHTSKPSTLPSRPPTAANEARTSRYSFSSPQDSPYLADAAIVTAPSAGHASYRAASGGSTAYPRPNPFTTTPASRPALAKPAVAPAPSALPAADWDSTRRYGTSNGTNATTSSHRRSISQLMSFSPHSIARASSYGSSKASLGGYRQMPGQSPHGPLHGAYTFCAFDTLPTPGRTAKLGGTVLLVGRDGSLEVLALDADRPRVVGRLEGLPGRVLQAKIMTRASHADPLAPMRPLVAVVLQQLAHPTTTAGAEGGEAVVANHAPTSPTLDEFDLPHIQTSAHVYSLRTQKLLSPLYHAKPVPCYPGLPGQSVSVQGRPTSLHLHASGDYLTISSGLSGEVYVFTANRSRSPSLTANNESEPMFKCLGKYWAHTLSRPNESRRQSHVATSSAHDLDDAIDSDQPRDEDVPLVSVSGRYLAVVSPPLSTKVSAQGQVPASLITHETRGIDAYTSSARPSVTCATDDGQSDSLLNKMARGLTQELFRGVKWIGEHGVQTWNNYWHRDAENRSDSSVHAHNGWKAPGALAEPAGLPPGYLPPTHAGDDASSHEPEVVSIFDLKRLEDEPPDLKSGHPAGQVAVFELPDGCSYLSLAPNGLLLLTSNEKGDVQRVWDLMQIRHRRLKAFLTEEEPCVPIARQVARFARLTTSTIVDCVWTAPNGEHLAVVTQKGTVHVHDMPPLAYKWPPPRRSAALGGKKPLASLGTSVLKEQLAEALAVSGLGSSQATIGLSNGVSALSNALKYMGDRTQPLLAATNLRKPSIPNLTGATALEVSAAAGLRGKKVVAAGFSKSVGAATDTVSTLRHARDNKLHLPSFTRDAVPGRIAWLRASSGLVLGVVDSGAFRAYAVQRSAHVSSKSSKAPRSVIGTKRGDMKLPSLIRPASQMEPLKVSANPADEPTGFWSLPSRAASHSDRSCKAQPQPLSQAELDSNAPYLPFHTDRRVSLRVYKYSPQPGDGGGAVGGGEAGAPWVFGGPIPSFKLTVCSPLSDEEGQEDGPLSDMENHVSTDVTVGDRPQVVVTTRRKRRDRVNDSQLTARGQAPEEEGFFEDDCEVLDFAEDRV